MTFEEFYKNEYPRLKETQTILEAMAEKLKNAGNTEEDVQPVVYYCSRIKSPESTINKLIEHGFPVSARSAVSNIYDAVGIRIICSFASDVFSIVEALENDDALEIIKKKDYLSRPKPNGYRSIHLRIRLKATDMLAEIQVRTIAMDFRATLEHQLKYKKNIPGETLIKKELKRCADEIASVDLSMQTIRSLINKAVR